MQVSGTVELIEQSETRGKSGNEIIHSSPMQVNWTVELIELTVASVQVSSIVELIQSERG
jgi:hypothetical protein